MKQTDTGNGADRDIIEFLLAGRIVKVGVAPGEIYLTYSDGRVATLGVNGDPTWGLHSIEILFDFAGTRDGVLGAEFDEEQHNPDESPAWRELKQNLSAAGSAESYAEGTAIAEDTDVDR